MKKIQFGSFPVVSVNPEERSCIDTFSIKNFASLITMSTAMGSIRSDEQRFITPDIVKSYFEKEGRNQQNSNNTDNKDVAKKAKIMKRAFNALKEFSRTIEGIPFYRDHKTFPIYLEHTSKNNSNDYDFLLLSNDLIQQQTLDEIHYDDKIVLIFLVLKDQLYRNVPLSKIGVDPKTLTIREDMAKILEFSRQKRIDPITVIVRLIKMIGQQKAASDSKQAFGHSVSSHFKNEHSGLSRSVSSSLSKLFKNGEIVSADYLLNTAGISEILNFSDDDHIQNRENHSQNTELERQYLAGKTQEYNKILSLVDALISFNKHTQIITDMDEVKGVSVTLDKNDQNNHTKQIEVKQAEVIQSIRDDHFGPFVESVVIKTNIIFNSLLKQANKNDPVQDGGMSVKLDEVSAEIAETRENLAKIELSYDSSTEASQMHQSLSDRLNTLTKRQYDLQNILMLNPGLHKAENDKKVLSALSYNLDVIQSELTSLLNDIESVVSSDSKIENLFKVIGSNGERFKQEDLEQTDAWKYLKMGSQMLTTSILDSIQDSIVKYHYETDEPEYQKAKSSSMLYGFSLSANTDKNGDFEGNLSVLVKEKYDKKVQDIIDRQIYLLFVKIGRQFSRDVLDGQTKYIDGRIDRHPTIAKMLKDPSNFKTYIFNDELMTSLYDTLFYLDRQKYIAGLIPTPPSQVFGYMGKYEMVLNRMGLNNNPVFILGSNKAVLSSPDFLSMTNRSFINEKSYAELEAVCKIDYAKELWNSNLMFKEETVKGSYDIHKDARATAEAATKAVKNAKIELDKLKPKKKGDAVDHVEKERLDKIYQEEKLKETYAHKAYKTAREDYNRVGGNDVSSYQPVGVSNNELRTHQKVEGVGDIGKELHQYSEKKDKHKQNKQNNHHNGGYQGNQNNHNGYQNDQNGQQN